MTAAKPWMKFYPQDWRADEKLRLCSLAARGLWMEMLALMHRSERYGHLLIGGIVPTDAQLAVQVGAPAPQVTELLVELDAAGVFSRAATGAIYSRRMTADEKKARIARKNGKSGGNPSLRKDKVKSPSDKGAVKGEDKPPLKLRDQRPEYSDTEVSGVPPDDPVKELFDLGVSILTSAGHTEREARTMIGKWRKDRGDEEVGAALLGARGKSDPLPWIQARFAHQRSEVDSYLETISRKYTGLKPLSITAAGGSA